MADAMVSRTSHGGGVGRMRIARVHSSLTKRCRGMWWDGLNYGAGVCSLLFLLSMLTDWTCFSLSAIMPVVENSFHGLHIR